MIHPLVEHEICDSILELMIPADNVANVIDTHMLGNAFLVLSQVKYSLIPVLSKKSTLIGLLSMPMIINAVTTVDSIELARLDEMKVSDVMLHEPMCVTPDCDLEGVMQYLIDHNFICVVDSQAERHFLGIITRKNVLKRLTHLLHESMNQKHLEAFVKQLARHE